MSIAIKVTDTITLTPASTDDELKAGVDAYRALDGNKLKAAVRKAANDAMMSAVMDMTLDAAESRANAQWAKNVGEMLVSAKASNQDDVDPAQILIDAVAELETAAWLIRNGLAVPAGLELADDFDVTKVEFVADAYNTKVLDAAVGETRATSIIAGAKAFAEAKRTRATDRIDIGQAILSAFDGLDSGAFLTVSEIAKRSGAQTGPVAARLFPTYRAIKDGNKVTEERECTVVGVTPGIGGKNNAKGAYKD